MCPMATVKSRAGLSNTQIFIARLTKCLAGLTVKTPVLHINFDSRVVFSINVLSLRFRTDGQQGYGSCYY